MLPPEPRTGPVAPLWAWALVVGFGAVAAYGGYTALTSRQLYLEGESVRADLAQQRDRLKANVADLTRQLEQANHSRDEIENALKQSRTNTEAASAQIADLQKQVADLQQQTADLGAAREAAEASAKTAKETAAKSEAAAAKAEKEVAALKAQLAAMQKKLNQALTDLKKERDQVSPVPMPPPVAEPPPAAAFPR